MTSGLVQSISVFRRATASAFSFNSQSPTSHQRKAATSAGSNVSAAKSSTRAGSLSFVLKRKPPPFSKFSMSWSRATYVDAGTLNPNRAGDRHFLRRVRLEILGDRRPAQEQLPLRGGQFQHGRRVRVQARGQGGLRGLHRRSEGGETGDESDDESCAAPEARPGETDVIDYRRPPSGACK